MKTAVHRVLFNIAFLTLSLTSFATPQDLSEIIVSRFSKIWHLAPQEKVYLHTDKPYLYSAGDDIWFRAHLVNASTFQPTTRSNFVYVELIDKSDSIITRIKIKKDDLGISGKISLDPKIASGDYVLRAYTYWMQNATSDFFFHKKLYIGNSIDDRVLMSHRFGTPENGKIPLTITFTNTFSTPLAQKLVMVNHGETTKRQLITKHTTNQQGEINLFITNDTTALQKLFIEVSMSEPGLKFKRKFQVPYHNNFDLQFFPESGTFLNNQVQTIGYKAIGSDGLSRNISGTIYNNNAEEITTFTSFHKGMGKIYLRTSPGESYYAVVHDEAGVVKKVELPATTSTGIALKVASNRNIIYYSLLNQTNIPLNQLLLMVHVRGIVCMVNPLKTSEGHFSDSFLPSGICTFSIIDSLGNTYCERLSFNRNFEDPVVTMQSDKAVYGKRAPVQLNFSVLSSDSLPAKGSFSVSVTDSRLVQPDSINDNLLSYLLLSGDLKGYVEEPLQYFNNNSTQTREKTDILMLTQGWRRFNTPEILKAKYPRTDYYMEIGQSVSGKVFNLFNNPVKNSEIIYLSNYRNQISTTKTDSAGHFLFESIEFPDSTNIILKAKSKSKIVDVELIADKDIFPSSLNKVNFSSTTKEIKNEYFNLSKERYYTEGGMLVINLEEFTVDAKTKPADSEYFYSGMADNTINAETLERSGGSSILNLISMMPGVQVVGQSVRVRGARQGPMFLVDGIETDSIDDIEYLSASDIEEISLFKGASTSMFGLRGGNGVIAITLKKGVALQHMASASLAHLTPLGYQKPVEFYVPKYEVDSVLNSPKADLRTTIYWAPSVQTDEQGKMQLNFFTADKVNDYNVELEGVSEKGDICRFKGVLKRE